VQLALPMEREFNGGQSVTRPDAPNGGGTWMPVKQQCPCGREGHRPTGQGARPCTGPRTYVVWVSGAGPTARREGARPVFLDPVFFLRSRAGRWSPTCGPWQTAAPHRLPAVVVPAARKPPPPRVFRFVHQRRGDRLAARTAALPARTRQIR
jgi:hypothetical protein